MDRSLQRRLGKTNYQHIKRLCRDRGQLFEDPDFPADARALFYSERSEEELASFSWARPHQLVDQPSIFVDGTSRRDVIQVLTRVLMISSDH